jgi:hypothetical protein
MTTFDNRIVLGRLRLAGGRELLPGPVFLVTDLGQLLAMVTSEVMRRMVTRRLRGSA